MVCRNSVEEFTGGDLITARRMREDFWTFHPTHKFIVAGNYRPRVRGQDLGIWRRLRLVPFEVTIPEVRRDPRLPQKLEGEWPGILAELVRACLDWQAHGLAAPDAILAATDSYRASQDRLAAFLDEACAIDRAERVSKAELYTAYQAWNQATGERPMSKRALGEELAKRGFEEEKVGKAKTRCWAGIGLEPSA